MVEKMSERELDKYIKERNMYRVKCACGHTLIISPLVDYKICSHCGHKVYNKKIQFENKLYELLKFRRENEI